MDRMNLLKVAREIAYGRRASEEGPPSEVRIVTSLADGSGKDVEYAIECSVGESGFDVVRVERVDTAQEVDPEAFKTIYGRGALETLLVQAEVQAGEIEEARDEELASFERGEALRDDAAENKMDEMRNEDQNQD